MQRIKTCANRTGPSRIKETLLALAVVAGGAVSGVSETSTTATVSNIEPVSDPEEMTWHRPTDRPWHPPTDRPKATQVTSDDGNAETRLTIKAYYEPGMGEGLLSDSYSSRSALRAYYVEAMGEGWVGYGRPRD